MLRMLALAICAPITDVGCDLYPEQAQIIADVTAVEAEVVEGQDVCTVTITPSYFMAHGLCPMGEEGSMQYQVCGPCPEVGAKVSGVLMKDAQGITRLD